MSQFDPSNSWADCVGKVTENVTAGLGLGIGLAAADQEQIMEIQVFENIWDALAHTPDEAANLTMRSSLLIAIEQKIKS
jgi:pyruvate/2-oxoglutarate/acetoin dehydrogenase E1 component